MSGMSLFVIYKDMKIKIILIVVFSIALTFKANAQVIEPIQKELQIDANVGYTNGIKYDFITTQQKSSDSKMTDDKIVCIECTSGKQMYEITQTRPQELTFVGVFETNNGLLLIYRNVQKKSIVTLTNAVALSETWPQWAPETILETNAKKSIQGNVFTTSSDGTKLGIGDFFFNDKKDGRSLHYTVIDQSGQKLYEQTFETSATRSNTTGAFSVMVGNDATCYMAFFSGQFIEKKSEAFTYYVYVANAEGTKNYKRSYQGLSHFMHIPKFCLTDNGDVFAIGITPNVSDTKMGNAFTIGIGVPPVVTHSEIGKLFSVALLKGAEEITIDTISVPSDIKLKMDGNLKNMFDENAPIVTAKQLCPRIANVLPDGSIVVIFENIGVSYGTKTEGKTTYTYYRHYQGALLLAHFDAKGQFVNCTYFDKLQKVYYNGDFDFYVDRVYAGFFNDSKAIRMGYKESESYWWHKLILNDDMQITASDKELLRAEDDPYIIGFFNMRDNYWLVKYREVKENGVKDNLKKALSIVKKKDPYNIGILHVE